MPAPFVMRDLDCIGKPPLHKFGIDVMTKLPELSAKCGSPFGGVIAQPMQGLGSKRR